MDRLEILNGSGHLTLEWNPDNEDELAKARQEVARLKAVGYSFYLVDDIVADEVAAGQGKLLVKRIEDPTRSETLTEAQARSGLANSETNVAEPTVRGRRSVALRPQAGG